MTSPPSTATFAAQGLKPVPWVANNIRSGTFERDRNPSWENFWRNHAKLAMWRRQGYTFDSGHFGQHDTHGASRPMRWTPLGAARNI